MPGSAKGLKRGAAFLKTGLAASLNADIDLAKVMVPRITWCWRGPPGGACSPGCASGISATCTGALFGDLRDHQGCGDTRVIKDGSASSRRHADRPPMVEIGTSSWSPRLLTAAGRDAGRAAVDGSGLGRRRGRPPRRGYPDHRSVEQAIDNTMELMASVGYAKEWQLERYWRDVKTLAVSLGTGTAQMDVARYFYETKTL